MQRYDASLKTQHLHRTARLLSLVLALAVTALFSLVPFKSPRVMFFPPKIAAEVLPTSAIDTTPRPVEYQDALFQDSTLLATVDARQDLKSSWTALLVSVSLFAGIRGQAGLSPWRARQVALPPAVHFRLRAPPLIG